MSKAVEGDTSMDEDGLEIALSCLEGHPRETELLDAISIHAGEIMSLLDGDLSLLGRVYTALGAGISSTGVAVGDELPDH